MLSTSPEAILFARFPSVPTSPPDSRNASHALRNPFHVVYFDQTSPESDTTRTASSRE